MSTPGLSSLAASTAPTYKLLLNHPKRRLRYPWASRYNTEDDICRGYLTPRRMIGSCVEVQHSPGKQKHKQHMDRRMRMRHRMNLLPSGSQSAEATFSL